MAATATTTIEYVQSQEPNNTTHEERIAYLERQLQGLLRWQENFKAKPPKPMKAQIVKRAQAHDKIKDPASVGPVPLPQLVAAVKSMDTPSVTPGIVTPAVLVEKTSALSTGAKDSYFYTPATTPGVETPAPVEEIKPTTPSSESQVLPTGKFKEVTHKILDVLQRYGQHLGGEDNGPEHAMWAGRGVFAPKIEKYIAAEESIKLVLPSFPWKSINRIDKVTGSLPDFGEELALTRLNNLCNDIAEVYEYGAQVTIASDGLAFNDLVGISDDETWDYSVALMHMAADKGFGNIKVVHVMELLGMISDEMTKQRYLDNVDACREELAAQFGRHDETIRDMIRSDNDTLLTYCGFIRFLETDLRYSPIMPQGLSGSKYRKIVKEVAQGMMNRAESFTKIIQAKLPDYIRLSIHPSSGAVKLSIPLIPQASGSFPKSPWHSSIAVGIDGSYTTVHSKDVRDTHKLIYRCGRPYFFREKSELYDWPGDEIVVFEHLYPKGLLVRPKEGIRTPQTILNEEHKCKLKKLAELQGSVFVQGFTNLADGPFPAKKSLQNSQKKVSFLELIKLSPAAKGVPGFL